MGFFSNLFGGADTKAANARYKGFGRGIDVQNQNRAEFRDLYNPSIQAGQTANNSLLSLLGQNGSQAAYDAFGQFKEAPGTEFVRQAGQRGIDNSAAARGTLFSGKTLADSARFNAGLADQGFNNYLAQLSGLSRQGLSAQGGLANGLTGTGNALANLYGQQGNALATGIIGKANRQTNLLQGGLNFLGRAAGVNF